jgi:hypothetical protein
MHVHSTRSIRCALLATLLAMGAIGCYKATFIANPQVVRGADHDQWNSFFLWGLVGEETLDVRQFCSGGQVAQVRTGGNFLTGLVSFVTIGIYAPRMAYVWCSAGQVGAPRAAVAPNESAAPTAAANGPVLSIYGDRQGRPVRVELRRSDAVDAVATPTAVQDEPHRWHVAFQPEVAR